MPAAPAPAVLGHTAAEEADDGEGAGDVSEGLNADLDKLSLGGKEEGAPGDKSSAEEEDQGAIGMK